MPVSDRMMELHKQLLALRISDWYSKVLSWQFAFLIIILVVPWVIWWKLVDRKRIIDIFSFGLVASTVSSVFNTSGLNLLLWSYPYHLLPFSSRAYSFSLSAIPVSFMLAYQYWPKWKAFAVAITILSAANAFIIQPLLGWANIYKLIEWNYFYSFLTMLSIGFISRLIHNLIIQRAYQAAPDECPARSQSSALTPAFKKGLKDR